MVKLELTDGFHILRFERKNQSSVIMVETNHRVAREEEEGEREKSLYREREERKDFHRQERLFKRETDRE